MLQKEFEYAYLGFVVTDLTYKSWSRHSQFNIDHRNGIDLSNFMFKKRVNLCATYPPQFTSSEAKAKKQKDERRKRARCLS